MQRRLFVAAMAALLLILPEAGLAQDKLGVLIMHGKNPGHPNAPSYNGLRSGLEGDGAIVLIPDMPWSAKRYFDGDWDQAMSEIAGHVKTLRSRGATKIVLAGHSMGCPAALSYAARHGDVDAVALMAPGHVPYYYYNFGANKVVRDSIDAARAMVAAGQGDQLREFEDINQGRPLKVRLTAHQFLSVWDPESDGEMSRTAPRVPARIPVLWVIGSEDNLIRVGRGYVFDKLPANPKSTYLEVAGNHVNTPQVAAPHILGWIRQAVAP